MSKSGVRRSDNLKGFKWPQKVVVGKEFKYQVLSRQMVESYDVPEPHIVISISGPNDPKAELPIRENCAGILRTEFHDITRKIDRLVPISDKQAQEIVEFVNRYKDYIGTFVVHCEAGISRSSGVASAIAILMGDDDLEFYEKFYPNRLVVEKILKAGGLSHRPIKVVDKRSFLSIDRDFYHRLYNQK